ncbi:hypothetical protein [Microbacterium invictum]|uniref:Uncharacterized protein n=1 Tax=Microbacterium invictum TaxID=515415 RepID=A0AA40VNW9_9MICO|nr:hypothetical protein [Microbacterium invictum]MBB4141229.1 hypothetical protein [Microbacterium invictum]
MNLAELGTVDDFVIESPADVRPAPSALDREVVVGAAVGPGPPVAPATVVGAVVTPGRPRI